MSERKKGFVCQNCGKNVPPKTDRCPYCGRFFKGVRCPQCHYIGVADDFVNGCPSCGYLGDEPGKGLGYMSEKNLPDTRKELPAWVYITAVGVLSLMVVALVVVLMNL